MTKRVPLLDPSMCAKCRFGEIRPTEDNTNHEVLCKRLDCDNWVTMPPEEEKEEDEIQGCDAS